MSGIVKIGTGVGTMLAPLLISWIITGQGWRNTYNIIGIIIFVCIVFSALLLRRDPARMNLLPDGEKVVNKEDIRLTESGYSLQHASRTRKFWLLCLAFFTVFFCTISIIVHFAPYVIEKGQSATFGAVMVSVIGGASIAGRLVMGMANDRIGSKGTLLICFFIFLVAFIWIQFAAVSWMFVVFAIIYGFCHGGFYTLLSPAVAEIFGLRSHGLIYGIVVFCGSIGGSLGPLLVGKMFDIYNSYQGSLLILLLLAGIGTISILFTGKTEMDTTQYVE
jgi:MFS family permease